MLTGDIRSQVDQIWNAFWTGGICNPLEVIEQITYLLFIKRLDDLHALEERKATTLKRPMERRVFPEGKDKKGMSFDQMVQVQEPGRREYDVHDRIRALAGRLSDGSNASMPLKSISST